MEEEEEQGMEEDERAEGEDVVIVPEFLSSSPVIDCKEKTEENQQEPWSQVWIL